MSKLIIEGAPSHPKELAGVQFLVVHHGAEGTDKWTADTFQRHRVDSAREWQRKEQEADRPGTLYAYSGLGYNAIVRPSGEAFFDVPLEETTWSTGGLNSRSIALCFAGDYMRALPTEAALKTAEQITVAWERKFGWRLKIIGHRDGVRYSKQATRTSCPGDRLYAYIPTLIRRVEGYRR